MTYAKVEFETIQNTARQSERKQKQKKQENWTGATEHQSRPIQSLHAQNVDELWNPLIENSTHNPILSSLYQH